MNTEEQDRSNPILNFPSTYDIVKNMIKNAKVPGIEYSIGKKVDAGSSCAIYSITKLSVSHDHPMSTPLIGKGLPKPMSSLMYNFMIGEIKAGLKLKEEYAPKLHDIIQNDFNYYLIFDKITGLNGYDYMAKSVYLKKSVALCIFLQLVEIVTYCHSIGIAHRDIKPENFMVVTTLQNIESLTPKIKLIDFGYCKIFNPEDPDDDFDDTDFCGTINYAAPEILRRQPYKPTLADVYSLGIVLYVLFTGDTPFTYEARDAYREQYRTRKITEHPTLIIGGDFPKELRDLLKSMLEITPSNRSTMIQVSQALSKIYLKNTEEKTVSSSVKRSLSFDPVSSNEQKTQISCTQVKLIEDYTKPSLGKVSEQKEVTNSNRLISFLKTHFNL